MTDLETKQMKTQGRPLAVRVIRSTEAIDFDAWADRYIAAILEAEGLPVPLAQSA